VSFMPSVANKPVMLTVVAMLNAIMPSVIRMSVVAAPKLTNTLAYFSNEE
jgi:hypothetical protein